MRAKSSTSDRERFAEWPAGWEVEADRLAAFYLRTIAGTDEYELDLTAAKELSKLAALVDRAGRGFQALLTEKNADQLVQAFWARMIRSQPETGLRISLDQLLAYRAEIERIATLNADFARDFEQAAELLQAQRQSDKGNQSTLALRFTIDVAASAYVKLFGKPPGRSRSGYGTFGKFVGEILKRVPTVRRPRCPSPSAINDAVKQWARRQPVAR